MPTTYESSNGAIRIIKWGLIAVALIIAASMFSGFYGHNDNHNWQVVQYPNGTTKIVSDGGYYLKFWGNVWTYPKFMQLDYTAEVSPRSPTDDSVPVTFNDGGNAKFSTVVRIELPTSDAQRLNFHQQLPAHGEDYYPIRAAVKAHLINCLKSTGPLMSASEHQTARKAEYTQVVQEQLEQGLFEMKRVEKTLKDQYDSKGNPITVFATEIILKEGTTTPVISQPSPFIELGIKIKQFSVVGTEYDEQTLKQFMVKKEAFLAGESSKAQREKEVQQRLMVVEKGLREKAEIEAESNKQLAAATIAANQEKLVAETKANQEKIVAETNAAKLVSVAIATKTTAETAAQQEKSVAETKAQQQLEVARLDRQAAEENAKKQVALAQAQETTLKVAGGLSEHDRILAEINAKRDVGVAEQLSKIAVPNIVFNGSSSGGAPGATGSDQGMNGQLVNLLLLKQMGVLDKK